jgi:hypothetical protein
VHAWDQVWYPKDIGLSPPLPHAVADGKRYVLKLFNATWSGADFRWATVAMVTFSQSISRNYGTGGSGSGAGSSSAHVVDA